MTPSVEAAVLMESLEESARFNLNKDGALVSAAVLTRGSVAEVVELDFATAERRRVAVASVLARAINEGFVAVGIVAEAWMVRRPFNTGERPSECDDRMPGVAVTVYDFGSEARYVSAAPFEEREGVKTFGPLTWVEGRGGEAE